MGINGAQLSANRELVNFHCLRIIAKNLNFAHFARRNDFLIYIYIKNSNTAGISLGKAVQLFLDMCINGVNQLLGDLNYE